MNVKYRDFLIFDETLESGVKSVKICLKTKKRLHSLFRAFVPQMRSQVMLSVWEKN